MILFRSRRDSHTFDHAYGIPRPVPVSNAGGASSIGAAVGGVSGAGAGSGLDGGAGGNGGGAASGPSSGQSSGPSNGPSSGLSSHSPDEQEKSRTGKASESMEQQPSTTECVDEEEYKKPVGYFATNYYYIL